MSEADIHEPLTRTEILALKAAVRERDHHACTECGMTQEESLERHGDSLEVHRIVPGSAYTMDGCVTLCKICHAHKPRQPVRRKILRPRYAPQRFGVRLESAWHARIQRQADLRGLSVSAYLREAAYERVRKEEAADLPPSDGERKPPS